MVKFVEILVIKDYRDTIRYSKPPYKLAYTRRSHDCLQPPLVMLITEYMSKAK